MNIFIKIKLIYCIDKSQLFCDSVIFVQRIWKEIDFESALGPLIYSTRSLCLVIHPFPILALQAARVVLSWL